MSHSWNVHALRFYMSLCCLFLCLSAKSQLNLSWGWNRLQATSWEVGFQEEVTRRKTPLFRNAVAFQLSWSHRAAHAFLSWHPLFSLERATQRDPISDRFFLERLALGAGMTLAVYLFELPQACDCKPLFPKGHWFRAGFHTWLSTGLMRQRLRMRVIDDLFPPVQTHWTTLPWGEVGSGITLKLSARLQLTPFARLRYYGSTEWPGLSALFAQDFDADRYDQTTLLSTVWGLRAGLRW